MSLTRQSSGTNEASQTNERCQKDTQLNDIHQRRLETLNSRDEAMMAESLALYSFLKAEPDIPEVEDEKRIGYKYPLTATQTFYTTIAAHNIPMYSYCYPAKLKSREKGIQWIIAKEVQLKNFKPFPSQFIQAYSLLKFFANTKRLFCQRIFDMYKIRSRNVYTFFLMPPVEYQSVRCALLNGRIVNSAKQADDESLTLDVMIQQLLSATEQLNLCGVAHRFLTIDNVFIGADKLVQFGSFDFATVFFNPMDQIKVLCTKGLGIAVPPEFHEHLPPEAFTPSGYDSSMTDIWSIAVLLCRILVGTTPFEALTRVQCSDPDKYTRHWRESQCRPMVPDAYRLFIDEIFRPINERMTLLDLLNDPFWIKKSPKRQYPYYRIDIRENINVEGPPKSILPISMEIFVNKCVPKVTDEVKNAFHVRDQFRFADKLESILKDYTIDIAGSFTEEMKFFHDKYYKAIQIKSGSSCALRIFCHSYPSRYRKLMASESCKIAKLCQQSQHKALFLEIFDIFITPNGKTLWVFYENVASYRPLSMMCTLQEKVVIRKLVQWLLDITTALEVISDCLAAHRYIRPEFVLIHTETNALKISHSDMAGFSVNPEHEKLSPRTQGMQDESENMWNHVPPEAFDIRYDVCTFDVWSFGVLICYCMTRGKWPFTCEQLRGNWMPAWIGYRRQYGPNLEMIPGMVNYLNQIFTHWEQRASVATLGPKLRSMIGKKEYANSKEVAKLTPTKKNSYNSNAKLVSIVNSVTVRGGKTPSRLKYSYKSSLSSKSNKSNQIKSRDKGAK